MENAEKKPWLTWQWTFQSSTPKNCSISCSLMFWLTDHESMPDSSFSTAICFQSRNAVKPLFSVVLRLVLLHTYCRPGNEVHSPGLFCIATDTDFPCATECFHFPVLDSVWEKKGFWPCNRCQPRNGLNLHTFLIQRYRIDVVCEREHEPKQCQFSLWWKTERPIGAHHVILQQYLEKQ